jgi:predicted RNA binding protein YcfA (HicA-like mRNA interferase family)
MPRLPVLSGREIIKLLETLGFAQSRQRGSHVSLRRGSKVCVVPLHREVAVGTLSGILRQAGVSSEEFVEALSR